MSARVIITEKLVRRLQRAKEWGKTEIDFFVKNFLGDGIFTWERFKKIWPKYMCAAQDIVRTVLKKEELDKWDACIDYTDELFNYGMYKSAGMRYRDWMRIDFIFLSDQSKWKKLYLRYVEEE